VPIPDNYIKAKIKIYKDNEHEPAKIKKINLVMWGEKSNHLVVVIVLINGFSYLIFVDCCKSMETAHVGRQVYFLVTEFFPIVRWCWCCLK
jgi:hypothetical protein